MNQPSESPVTELLQAAASGDPRALDGLFAHVYSELKRLAHQVRGGRAGETMNTTALVHEAYLKLLPSANIAWENRAHFFGVAARAMRQILVDSARRQLAQKRGGGERSPVSLDESVHGLHEEPMYAADLLVLDQALDRLAAVDPRRARVVEHRFFAGLSTRETAELLGISTGTVERDWRAARAWLALEIAAVEEGER
jgi:RNA polymerase sigma factor (TIGR02999 family)